MAKGPTKIVSLTTRIERELTVPAETITALGQQEMPRATVEVRWAAAPTVAVEEEAAMVDAMAMRSRGEDMEDQTMTVEAETVGVIIGEKGMEEVTGGMIAGKGVVEEGKEEEEEDEVEAMEEATAVPLGQAPVTARLLQSRVEGVEAEDITVDSGVEEAVETPLLSRIGGTMAGLAAQMCLRIAQCSQWGEALIPPNHPLRPLATLFPRSPSALGRREATRALAVTDLMPTTRIQ